MIKNQLYPYIEEYINEYLWGFSKEQIEVGLMDGTIKLDNLNIRPDKANSKLDSSCIPFWIKVGSIKNIQISCSLMNFIGEKPLEVIIQDIDCLICPSLKFVNDSSFNYLVEDLASVKERYNPSNNNHQDIFKKKMVYNDDKQDSLDYNENVPLFTRIMNKITEKAKKFFLKKTYLTNIIIKNVHIRFEDDLFNFYGKTCLGIKIDNVEIKLTLDGSLKKSNFKIDNLSIYHESDTKIIIPTDYFFNKKYVFEEEYYKYIKKIKFDTGQHKQFIINNFSSKGNIGFKFVGMGINNIDFFGGPQKKNVNFYFQVATSSIDLYIDKEICNKINDFHFYVKNYSMIFAIQKFKPKRRPYSKNSILVSNNKKNTVPPQEKNGC